MIVPFGESALLVELADWRASRALAATIDAAPVDGIVEVVPGLRSLLLEVDRTADTTSVAVAIEALIGRGLASTAGSAAGIGVATTQPRTPRNTRRSTPTAASAPPRRAGINR